MSSVFNPYEILGIHKSCRDLVQIRRAFNKKALLVHPDRPGSDNKAFRRLKKAYDYIVRKAGLVREEERMNSQTNEERLEEYKRLDDALFPLTPKSGVVSEPWRNEIKLDNSVLYIPEEKSTEQVSGEIGLWKEPEAYCPESCSAEILSSGGIFFIKETSRIIDFDDAIEMEKMKRKKRSTGNHELDSKRFLQQETVGYLETEPVLEREDIPLDWSKRQTYEEMRSISIEKKELEMEKSRKIVMGQMDKFSVNFQNMVSGRLSINF